MSFYSTYEDMVAPTSRGLDDDRDHARELLAMNGWTGFDSERSMAEALVEQWGEDGLSLDIEDEIAGCKFYLESAMNEPSNDTEYANGERAQFDYTPTDAQRKRITAHCIALVMSKAGISVSDLPIQEAS